MDNSRRFRRGRQRRPILSIPIFGGMKNLVIFCLVITMMQWFYSYNRPSRHELKELVRNVDEIARQLIDINTDYEILENKLSVYSEELPILENKFIALETLSQTMQANPNWEYRKSQASLPYVGANLKNLNGTIQEIPVQNHTCI